MKHYSLKCYCYNPITNSLKSILQRKDYLKKCELWRNREIPEVLYNELYVIYTNILVLCISCHYVSTYFKFVSYVSHVYVAVYCMYFTIKSVAINVCNGCTDVANI